VAIFKNRVEVRNPGKLYGGLTIADLRRGNVSQRRNPLIADLFRRIEMVESWGRGMTLIHQNAPAVEFRQVAGLFIASFVRPSFSLNDQETVEKTVYKTVDNSNKPTLTVREDTLLRLLASTPQMTQKQLADQLGLSERGVRYLTDKLQQLGVLQRQGGKKAGQWVVVQAPNDRAAP
jgi:predicted HTH transcriptional regulator